MFGSSLALVVCSRVHVLFILFVCSAYPSRTHGLTHGVLMGSVLFFVLVFCVVLNVLFCLSSPFVLYVQYWQCLWIVHFIFPFRFSLTFICNVYKHIILLTTFRIVLIHISLFLHGISPRFLMRYWWYKIMPTKCHWDQVFCH